MLKFIKEQIDLWRFKKTPLAQMMREHTQNYFSFPSLAGFKQDNRERLVHDFSCKVGSIIEADDPVMACREALVEHTLVFTQLQVHCLNEGEKAEQFYSANPYISGQLWRHISETYQHHLSLPRSKLTIRAWTMLIWSPSRTPDAQCSSTTQTASTWSGGG